MSPHASVPIPLEIDDVERARASAGEIRLRVSGRWLAGHAPTDADEALLVVQIEGRRHRFPPAFDPQQPAPARWTATFVIPGWAEPRREGQAALWIGESVIPLPPLGVSHSRSRASLSALGSAVPADDLALGTAPAAPPPGPGSEPPESALAPPETSDLAPPEASDLAPPEASALAPPTPDAPSIPGGSSTLDLGGPEWSLPGPAGDTPRSGPLADILLKETVAALHGELEARSSEAAQLRGALAAAQSELRARADSEGALEGTLGELGAELRRLTEAVEDQRAELERRAAEADAARAEFDAERAEFATERAELERRLAELADARETEAQELAAVREHHATALAAVREEQAAELRELHEQRSAAEATVRRRASETAALREELAAAQVAREAARGEAAGLRAELERLGSELAATRERVQSESGDLGEANRLLADARALAEQLRDQPPPT